MELRRGGFVKAVLKFIDKGLIVHIQLDDELSCRVKKIPLQDYCRHGEKLQKVVSQKKATARCSGLTSVLFSSCL